MPVSVNSANQKRESTFPSIVGRMERGFILARIARGRPLGINMKQLLQIEWLTATIVVLVLNEMGVQSIIC